MEKIGSEFGQQNIKDFKKDLLFYLQFSQFSVIVTYFSHFCFCWHEQLRGMSWNCMIKFQAKSKIIFHIFFSWLQKRSKNLTHIKQFLLFMEKKSKKCWICDCFAISNHCHKNLFWLDLLQWKSRIFITTE